MARMYSKKHGKSGSKKPLLVTKSTWIRHNKEEIELLIQKLAKSGKTPSQIGTILRDNYGVPDVKNLTKQKINKILLKHNIKTKVPEDLAALIKKDIKILKHLELNKKDKPTKRGLTLTENKIRKLARYYKKIGKLPANWMYDKSKAGLYLE